MFGQNIVQLGFAQPQEVAVNLGHNVSGSVPLEYDLYFSEIRTCYLCFVRNFEFSGNEVDSTFADEVYFGGHILVLVDHFLLLFEERDELGDNVGDELLTLVCEEIYFVQTISMHRLGYFDLEVQGQLFEQVIALNPRLVVDTVVVLKGVSESVPQVFAQVSFFAELIHKRDFILQVSVPVLDVGQNRGKRTDSERLDSHTENHPDYGEDVFPYSEGRDVSLAYCG